jgi:hypothetical protein
MALEATLLQSKEYPANDYDTRQAVAGCFLFAAANRDNLETFHLFPPYMFMMNPVTKVPYPRVFRIQK